MPYLILLAYASLNASTTLLNKQFQITFEKTPENYAKHALIIAVVTGFFLCLFNGFNLQVNLPTLIFAVIHATLVLISLPLGLIALNFTSLSIFTITNMSGSLIISSLFSFIFLSTPLTFPTIVSIVLMLVAVVLPHLFPKNKAEEETETVEEKPKKKVTAWGIVICLILFVLAGATSILSKLFTLTPSVTDSNSWLTLSNGIVAIASFIVLIFFAIFKKEKGLKVFSPFPLKPSLYLFSHCAVTGISAPLSVYAVSLVSLPVYSVVTSALSIISSFLLSLFFFKEKTSLPQIISVILVTLAIFVTLF